MPGITLPNGLIIADGLVMRSCPVCGLIGARDRNCWSQHCNCGTNFSWCCGTTGDVYGHLGSCEGSGYSIYGTSYEGNPDLTLTPDIVAQLNHAAIGSC